MHADPCFALQSAPLGAFGFFWWIKGNFDVWGTYPRRDIMPDEPISTFSGCDAALLGGARIVYLVCYAMILVTCCSVCFMCATVVVSLKDASEDMEKGERVEGGDTRYALM